MRKDSSKCERLIRRIPDDGVNAEYKEHLAECDDCRTMDKMLEIAREDEDLHGALSPFDDLTEKKYTDAVLARFREEEADGNGVLGELKLKKILIGVAAVMIFGLCTWFLGFDDTTGVGPGSNILATKAPIAFIAGSNFASLTGEVFVGKQAAEAAGSIASGIPIDTRDGSAVVTLPFGIVIYLSRDTALSIREESGGGLVVDFSYGSAMFSLDPERKRQGFRVETGVGRIQVKGTVFTVESEEGSVSVHLHRGKLTVRQTNGESRSAGPGQSMVLGKPGTQVVSMEATLQMKTWAQKITSLGLADHLSTLSAKPNPVIEEETETPALLAESNTRSSFGEERAGSENSEPTLKELMVEARAFKRDRNWKAAARVYKNIIYRYPRSDDAKTSQVFVGQLYLTRLGRPKRALEHFSEYLVLHGDGPLAQEALFGRAKALRALGKKAAERDALLELISQYPNGINSGLARKRLKELL